MIPGRLPLLRVVVHDEALHGGLAVLVGHRLFLDRGKRLAGQRERQQRSESLVFMISPFGA